MPKTYLTIVILLLYFDNQPRSHSHVTCLPLVEASWVALYWGVWSKIEIHFKW